MERREKGKNVLVKVLFVVFLLFALISALYKELSEI